MTSKVADRYVRTGTTVPSIYPGNLKGLTLGLREVSEISKVVPGEHVIEAVYDGVRCPFRVYEGGECIWQEQQPT